MVKKRERTVRKYSSYSNSFNIKTFLGVTTRDKVAHACKLQSQIPIFETLESNKWTKCCLRAFILMVTLKISSSEFFKVKAISVRHNKTASLHLHNPATLAWTGKHGAIYQTLEPMTQSQEWKLYALIYFTCKAPPLDLYSVKSLFPLAGCCLPLNGFSLDEV